MSKRLERIKRAVVEQSEADTFEEAVKEWEPCGSLVANKAQVDRSECTCLCGQQRLKYLYLFKNCETGEPLQNDKGRYVGSTCVHAFNVSQFDSYVNLFEGGGVTIPDLVNTLERAFVSRDELGLWEYQQRKGEEFQHLLTSFTPDMLRKLLVYDALPHDVNISLPMIFMNPSVELTVPFAANPGSINAARFLQVMKREYGWKPGEAEFTSQDMRRAAFECVWEICYGDNGGGVRKWLREHSVTVNGITRYSISSHGLNVLRDSTSQSS